MYLILFTSFLRLLNAILPDIIGKFVETGSQSSSEESSLRTRELELKQTLAGLSMIDEFAKYAKLQRELNKVQSDLQERANTHASSQMKKKAKYTLGIRAYLGLVLLGTVWLFRSTPVVVLPAQWLHPLGGLLGWPCAAEGAVSLSAWLLLLEGAARALGAAIPA